MLSSQPYCLTTTRRVYSRSRKQKAAAPVVAHDTARSQPASPPMVPMGVAVAMGAEGGKGEMVGDDGQHPPGEGCPSRGRLSTEI